MNKITIEFLDGKTKVTGAASALDVINGAAALISYAIQKTQATSGVQYRSARKTVLEVMNSIIDSDRKNAPPVEDVTNE